MVTVRGAKGGVLVAEMSEWSCAVMSVGIHCLVEHPSSSRRAKPDSLQDTCTSNISLSPSYKSCALILFLLEKGSW